jgi:hypothetical protein
MRAGKQDYIHKVCAYISFKRNNFYDSIRGEDNFLMDVRKFNIRK